jgi:hypothetical protein
MSQGRVFRRVDDHWEPIGEALPVWDHVPPRLRQPINIWVLPRGQAYQVGDVIAFGETGHRLLSLAPKDDAAWGEVLDAALVTNTQDHVREWAGQIELWLGMRIGGPWR